MRLKKLRTKQDVLDYVDGMEIGSLSDVVDLSMNVLPENNRGAKLLFEQIPIDKTVVVVGNGPVRKKLGEQIDSFDVVVRFNRYILSEETGYRLPDIHFANNQIGHVAGYREGILTIGMECQKFFANYDRYHNSKFPNFFPVKEDMLRKMCEVDSTRGFYGLALMLKCFERVYMVGFGGKGHHRDPDYNTSLHHIDAEHRLLDRYRKPGSGELVLIKPLESDEPHHEKGSILKHGRTYSIGGRIYAIGAACVGFLLIVILMTWGKSASRGVNRSIRVA